MFLFILLLEWRYLSSTWWNSANLSSNDHHIAHYQGDRGLWWESFHHCWCRSQRRWALYLWIEWINRNLFCIISNRFWFILNDRYWKMKTKEKKNEWTNKLEFYSIIEGNSWLVPTCTSLSHNDTDEQLNDLLCDSHTHSLQRTKLSRTSVVVDLSLRTDRQCVTSE